MKKTFLFFVFVFHSLFTQAQLPGQIVEHKITAPSIQNNKGGEDPVRHVSVYLPPGYDNSTQRYPVLYFLHGYGATDKDIVQWFDLRKQMDAAITSGKIKPFIIVLADSRTRFLGSFYINSPLAGNWGDFIARDLVAWADKNFRTIADRKSRGVAGHSMGGYGTLRMAMLYPDVFSSAYALSPAAIDWHGEFTVNNSGFKRVARNNNLESILKGLEEAATNHEESAFFSGVFTSMARMISPDENAGPLQARFPVEYKGDSAIYNIDVIKQWEKNFPMNMVDEHLDALRNLTALKLDWGRNENFPHVPFTALQLSKKLEAYKIEHFAEEYLGDHGNMIGGVDGRFNTEVLPFFNTYLEFPPAPATPVSNVNKRKK